MEEDIYERGYYSLIVCLDDGTWSNPLIYIEYPLTYSAIKDAVYNSDVFGDVVDVCPPQGTDLDDPESHEVVTKIGVTVR